MPFTNEARAQKRRVFSILLHVIRSGVDLSIPILIVSGQGGVRGQVQTANEAKVSLSP